MRLVSPICSTQTVRLCTAMVIISVALVSASARGATVRTDGTYYRVGRDRIAHHFRFYTDGVVISAATPETDTPAKIARWFRRDWPLVAKGRYSVRGGTLRLTSIRSLRLCSRARFSQGCLRHTRILGSCARIILCCGGRGREQRRGTTLRRARPPSKHAGRLEGAETRTRR